MGMLKRFWRWLTGEGRRRNTDYGDPRLTPIDIERLVNELRVRTTARELGEKCLPTWSGQELAGAELQLIFEIQRVQEGYGRWAQQRLAALNEQINACDLVSITNRAKQVGNEFGRTASANVEQWRAELSRLNAKLKSREQEFADFKSRHKLKREPHYPSPGRKWWGIAILFALVVAEGAINSFFFAKGLWGGILSGFAFAGFFSLLNIGIAYLWGRYLAPFVHHVDWPIRTLAILSLVIYAFILVALALSIGHYRDAMGAGPANAEAVMQAILNEPHKLKDFQSWILAIASVFFGVLAFLDAYSLEDVYPGYGHQHRKLLEASDEYEAQKSGLRAELEALKVNALRELERLYEDAKVQLKSLDAAIHQKETTRQSFEGAAQEVEKAAQALLGIFRDENMKARPAHCQNVTFPPFPGIKTPSIVFDVQFDRQKYQLQSEEIEHLRAQVEQIRALIQSSFNRQVDAQLPVDSIMSTHQQPA